jgi:hypothetical protein
VRDFSVQDIVGPEVGVEHVGLVAGARALDGGERMCYFSALDRAAHG